MSDKNISFLAEIRSDHLFANKVTSPHNILQKINNLLSVLGDINRTGAPTILIANMALAYSFKKCLRSNMVFFDKAYAHNLNSWFYDHRPNNFHRSFNNIAEVLVGLNKHLIKI
ncbi:MULTISPECIES: hypothetical protein [unclassified Psychrobacter]|uniref:hypothetical protein n=1 Tax=unclassified Psychrobacter TaxID=196806 RepID=UPI003FB9B99C